MTPPLLDHNVITHDTPPLSLSLSLSLSRSLSLRLPTSATKQTAIDYALSLEPAMSFIDFVHLYLNGKRCLGLKGSAQQGIVGSCI
jgi:hypothetical protein